MGDWDEFYRAEHVHEPSSFARAVAQQWSDEGLRPAALVDLGCGNGRDSQFFAKLGVTVVGVDRSPVGIAAARASADPNSGVRFVVGDVADPRTWQQIAGAVDASTSVLYYGRFLLHALPPAQRGPTLDFLHEVMGPADCAVFEFRTTLDAALPKVRENARWFVDVTDLERDVARRGLDLRVDAVGTGLAVFGDEDPHVARVTLTRCR